MKNYGKAWRFEDLRELKRRVDMGESCGSVARDLGRSNPTCWARYKMLTLYSSVFDRSQAGETTSRSLFKEKGFHKLKGGK